MVVNDGGGMDGFDKGLHFLVVLHWARGATFKSCDVNSRTTATILSALVTW